MVLGSLAGTILLLAVLWRGAAGVRLRATALAPDLPLLKQIIRIGLPATAQRLSLNLGNALFMTLITSLGKTVLVAYAVVNRVTGFLLCPVTGVGMATATLVGQNLGAGRQTRVAQAIRQSMLAGAASAFVLIGLLNLWPRPLLGLFTSDGEAIRQGIVAARFMLYVGVVSALNQTLSGALTGAGDTLSPMLANIAAEYAVQLPIAYVFVRVVPVGAVAVWAALAVGQTVAAATLALVVRRGRWKRVAT